MRPKIRKSNILITGGAGFIGSNLVDIILNEAPKKLVIVDNLFLGKISNIKDACEKGAIFINENIESFFALSYIFEKYDIDIVFNCATKPLNYSFINPKDCYETNVKGILNLLELQRKGAFKTLCHLSTSEVYGTAKYEPMDENHPKSPTTTYAAGKAAADLALKSYVNMFGIDAFIVRPFNNYGPKQNYKGDLAGVIPITIYRILTNEPPVIYGNGQQTRDFIYVKDTVDIIVRIFNKIKSGDEINISGNKKISIKYVVEKICDILNYDKNNIKYLPKRSADVDCHIGSNEKIKRLINFKLTPFEKGLEKTIKWYLKEILNDYD